MNQVCLLQEQLLINFCIKIEFFTYCQTISKMSGSNSRDVRISKSIAKVTRHKYEEYGLEIDKSGFLSITSLLECKNKQGQPGLLAGTTREDLMRVVENDSKKRYTIKGDMIRANQGHTKRADIDDSAMHTTLTGSTLPERVLHGTNRKAMLDIKAS